MSLGKNIAVVVCDLETGGTDPERHQIFEIGARVLYEDGIVDISGEALRSTSMRCPFYRTAKRSIGAARVNGIWSSTRAETHKDEKLMLVDFAEWLGIEKTIIIAGINPHFDLGFLLKRGEINDLELGAMFSHRVFDLHSLALLQSLANQGEINLTSSEIYAAFGEEPEAKPHNAEEGTRREFELFTRLIMGATKANPVQST